VKNEVPFFDALKSKVQKHLNTIGNNKVGFGTKIKAFRSVLKEVRNLLSRRFPKFPCPPGCSDCCYRIPIITSRIELEYLSREMFRNYPAKIHAIEQSKGVYQVWQHQCRAAGVRNFNPFDPNVFQYDWAKVGIPCPFLADHGCLLDNKPVECQFLRRTERTCDHKNVSNNRSDSLWEIVERDPILDGLINLADIENMLADAKREIVTNEKTHLDVLREWCTTFDTWLHPEKKGKFIRTPIFALLGPGR